MKDIFKKLISGSMWTAPGTVCGRGSTMATTENLRNNLPAFLKKYNIQSMFDAPCGDYTWMSKIEFPKDFKYIGGDIVDSLIEKNKTDYPGVNFQSFDLVNDPIPDVDLLFCRYCLIHFSNDDIKKTIDNISKSNVKYVLTTNYTVKSNSSIPTGGYRPLNLMAPPFNLSNPIDFIDDSSPCDAAHMSLWSIDQFCYKTV